MERFRYIEIGLRNVRVRPLPDISAFEGRYREYILNFVRTYEMPFVFRSYRDENNKFCCVLSISSMRIFIENIGETSSDVEKKTAYDLLNIYENRIFYNPYMHLSG